jgi:hypothetical protein
MITRLIRWFLSLFSKKQVAKVALSGNDVVVPRLHGASVNRRWHRAMAQFCDNPKPVKAWFGYSGRKRTRRLRKMAASHIQRGCK